VNVTMLSMWYADAGKHLADRVLHLLNKPGVNRWIFTVRPHADCTEQFLCLLADYAGKGDEVVIYKEPEEQISERINRLSVAGDRLLSMVDDEADYVLWHESDLFTPDSLVPRLLETPAAAIGGWPVLSHDPEWPELGVQTPKRMTIDPPFFYDTWGYRAGGTRFCNQPPFHEVYRPEPFQLDTVGSVVLVDAGYVRRGARMNGGALVGLCDSIRGMGGEVWCDPSVPVVQPAELWVFNND
jgi:hypothetical protein